MKWNRLTWVVPALALAVAAGGCESDLTEINANPNAPEEVPVGNVLLGGIWDVVANAGNRGAFGQWAMLYHGENWAQHLAQPVYNDEDFYVPRDGVPLNIWNEMYAALTDLDYVKDVAEAEGSDNLWAVAEIMTVYGFMILTDYFGDIPYTEALSLDQDIIFPAYDPQSAIYPDLIDRLEAAAGRIDPGANVAFDAFDPIYQGDMDGWQKFANSLRLRLALRAVNTSMNGEAASEFQAAWGANTIGSVADAADVEWAGAEPAANPVYEGIILAGRTGDFRMSSSLVDRLDARNDPRLAIYAEPAVSDGEFRGLRNGMVPSDLGLGASDFSTIGSYFLEPDAPSVLMSYAEVLFLGAEAAEMGWITADAADLYARGIEASMTQYGIAQAAIDAYLAQPAVAYTGVDDIWLQKWFALYLAGPEAFNEMRRVGWMDLEPAENSALPAGEFPSRLYYPPEEALYNPENFIDLGSEPLTVPVWWEAS